MGAEVVGLTSAPVQRVLDRIRGVKPSGKRWVALCPAHADKERSLSIGEGEDGRVLIRCHAGCPTETIVSALGLEMRDLFTEDMSLSTPSNTRATAQPTSENPGRPRASGVAPVATEQATGCTLATYAAAKKLPNSFLQELGLRDATYSGGTAVRIPYLTEDGGTAAVRFRINSNGDRFRWRAGDKPNLYGLWRLPEGDDEITLVEGESDCHTLWHHGVPAVGIPGANNWREDRDASHLKRYSKVFVVIEGDRGGETVMEWLANSSIHDRVWLVELGVHKDPSGLHIADSSAFLANWKAACQQAVKWTDHQRERSDQASQDAWQRCRDLAESPDILGQFRAEIGRVVVGEANTTKILFLAVISRLLSRPISIAVKGPSSGGKSYITEQVLSFFPADAFYALTSMSEHALAYSEEPLKHRMLVVYEASGMEGKLQSYLIRSLLSEGRLRYETVQKTNEGLKGVLIEREGPTGLIVTTTATKLHPENETRLLSVTVSDTQEQTKGVMVALADEAMDDEISTATDKARWHALQVWLAGQPHRVIVPYAKELQEMVPAAAVRLRRDFKAILNLIQAHALLHQASRERDDKGRIVADLADYEAVHPLVADLVAAGVEMTVPETVRETVRAVTALIEQGNETVPVTQLCAPLNLERSAVWRRVKQALERGYLKNLEKTPRKPATLVLGDAMPNDLEILPNPDRLRGCVRSREDSTGDDDIEREAIMAIDGVSSS